MYYDIKKILLQKRALRVLLTKNIFYGKRLLFAQVYLWTAFFGDV